MKDKLVHTGHKKLYYRFRTIGLALLIALGIAGVSAAPIALTATFASIAASAEKEEAEELPSYEAPVASSEVSAE